MATEVHLAPDRAVIEKIRATTPTPTGLRAFRLGNHIMIQIRVRNRRKSERVAHVQLTRDEAAQLADMLISAKAEDK